MRLMTTIRYGLLLIVVAATATYSAGEKPELLVLNWSEYIDPGVVEAFEEKFQVDVKEVYFESDDDRDAMLQETEGKGYDLAIVNGLMVPVYAEKGWLAPIDRSKAPNLQHIDPRWASAVKEAERYGVPYFWGTLGIAYRKDLVSEPITSWMQLFRPSKELQGKIVMMNNSRDLLGMALVALGYSGNSERNDEIDRAERLLLEQKPYVKRYGYVALSEKSGLVSGDIVAAMNYSGDTLMLQEHHPEIAYAVPKEGTNLWIDYWVVLASAKNKELALTFLDYINEPRTAARLADYLHYATPNVAARQYLPADFFEDPVVYPDDAILRRSEVFSELSPRAAKRRNEAFSKVIN